MNENNRVRVLTGVAILLAVVAAVVWSRSGQNVKPPPSASGYYTGPMKAKGGDTYGTEDGKQVPPPADAAVGQPRPSQSSADSI